MKRCSHGSEYIARERPLVAAAIAGRRWLLSVDPDYDVGFGVAVMDFVDRHVRGFARDYNRFFCGHICPDRKHCAVRRHQG